MGASFISISSWKRIFRASTGVGSGVGEIVGDNTGTGPFTGAGGIDWNRGGMLAFLDGRLLSGGHTPSKDDLEGTFEFSFLASVVRFVDLSTGKT